MPCICNPRALPGRHTCSGVPTSQSPCSIGPSSIDVDSACSPAHRVVGNIKRPKPGSARLACPVRSTLPHRRAPVGCPLRILRCFSTKPHARLDSTRSSTMSPPDASRVSLTRCRLYFQKESSMRLTILVSFLQKKSHSLPPNLLDELQSKALIRCGSKAAERLGANGWRNGCAAWIRRRCAAADVDRNLFRCFESSISWGSTT